MFYMHLLENYHSFLKDLLMPVKGSITESTSSHQLTPQMVTTAELDEIKARSLEPHLDPPCQGPK